MIFFVNLHRFLYIMLEGERYICMGRKKNVKKETRYKDI